MGIEPDPLGAGATHATTWWQQHSFQCLPAQGIGLDLAKKCCTSYAGSTRDGCRPAPMLSHARYGVLDRTGPVPTSSSHAVRPVTWLVINFVGGGNTHRLGDTATYT